MITEEQKEELRLMVVTMMMSTVVFNESHDDLKETNFYNNKLKITGKQFEIQITKLCNNWVNELWNADEKAASDFTESIRKIAKHVASLKPSKIVEFADNLKN
jgi:hypothetical protein